ncbi:MAG: DUF4177 domain-containing protein [Oscillospiraceae bacterium]|nr:DUF4177 domain-containing protein [Oscillospiraceae bacterium]
MKEYKLVYLNPKLHLSQKADLSEAEDTLNKYAKEGWILQQITPPSNAMGTLVAVMYKEIDD